MVRRRPRAPCARRPALRAYARTAAPIIRLAHRQPVPMAIRIIQPAPRRPVRRVRWMIRPVPLPAVLPIRALNTGAIRPAAQLARTAPRRPRGRCAQALAHLACALMAVPTIRPARRRPARTAARIIRPARRRLAPTVPPTTQFARSRRCAPTVIQIIRPVVRPHARLAPLTATSLAPK